MCVCTRVRVYGGLWVCALYVCMHAHVSVLLLLELCARDLSMPTRPPMFTYPLPQPPTHTHTPTRTHTHPPTFKATEVQKQIVKAHQELAEAQKYLAEEEKLAAEVCVHACVFRCGCGVSGSPSFLFPSQRPGLRSSPLLAPADLGHWCRD